MEARNNKDVIDYVSLFNYPFHSFLQKLGKMNIKEANAFCMPRSNDSEGFPVSTASFSFLEHLYTNPEFALVSMVIELENGIEIDTDCVNELYIKSSNDQFNPQVKSFLTSLGIDASANSVYMHDGMNWKQHKSFNACLQVEHAHESVPMNGVDTNENYSYRSASSSQNDFEVKFA